jgi:hypothetical protein
LPTGWTIDVVTATPENNTWPTVSATHSGNVATLNDNATSATTIDYAIYANNIAPP